MAVFTLALCAMFALRATGEPAKLRRPLATRLSTRRPASARALSRGTLPATEAAPYGVGTVTPGEPIKCRAAVAWGAKQPIKIEEVWVDPPKEGEVRVRVIANALCHTGARVRRRARGAHRARARARGNARVLRRSRRRLFPRARARRHVHA